MASRPATKEYKIRLADSKTKLLNIMRFKHPHKCEIDKLTDPVLQRQEIQEKELTEEEARKLEEWKKKKRFRPRKQNPDDQPWILKEKKKDGLTFYGRKEGGINSNAAYYILRLGQDGDFEALPVNNWYNFVPPVKYNFLNDEEAEERFEKRNKTLNYFSIMVSKRIKESAGGVDEEQVFKGAGRSGVKAEDSDSDNDGFSSLDSDNGGSKSKKGGTSNKKKGKLTKKKKKRIVSNDVEAEEESDEGDFESKEVDYFSSSNSEDEEKFKAVKEEPRDDAEVERKEEKGIDKVFDETSSDEQEEELTESGKALKVLIYGEDEDGNEDDETMDDSKMDTSIVEEPEKVQSPPLKLEESLPSSSKQSSTPPAKKPKLETSTTISAEEVKKYLSRKPVTSKALVKKFLKLKTDLDKTRVVNLLSMVLKSMPQIEKQKIKGKMYLSIRSDEIT